MTDKNMLELEEFSANSFMGIDQSNPVVIDFTKRRKNQNIVEFTSDQGTGKTSTLLGIMFAMGAAFDLDKKKLFNHKDGKIDLNLRFTYDGDQYEVRGTSTRIDLKKLHEDGKWRSEDSPMAFLRKIFGPVGLSPLSIRTMKGRDQIKFMQDLFGSGEDATRTIKKLEEEIETLFGQRRDANRDVKLLQSALEVEPLYQNREASEQRFAKPINSEKEKAVYDDKAKKLADYNKYKENLNILKAAQKDTIGKIERLKAELAAAELEAEQTAHRIENGDKWMEDNKGVQAEYDAAHENWLNLSRVLADQEKWKDILKRERQFNERHEQAAQFDAELMEKREKLLKATKKCLPPVDGLDIKVATGLDKTDQQEGIFYNGQPIHELSTSEYEALWAQIFVKSEMPFLFFENLNNFGSETLGLLNRLAKEEGVVIFGTRTNPAIKEMGVSFKAKID